MTTYGTIPSPSQLPLPSTDLEFVSRAKARIKSDLATRRPWMEFFCLSSLTFPASLWDLITRIRINASIFRANYAILMLTVLFLSLLWQPKSLIVFVIAMVVWVFLYFLRDEPLVVFGRLVEDRFVLWGLLLGTVIALAFTHATKNIIAALSIGFGVVIAHGALMATSDLVVDEVGTSLGEAASDSYSIPYHFADDNRLNETTA